jgi:hypothetical protein
MSPFAPSHSAKPAGAVDARSRAAPGGRLRDGGPERPEGAGHDDRLALEGHAASPIGAFAARNCVSALARAFAASAALASFTRP